MAAHMTLTWRAPAVANSLCAAEPVGPSTLFNSARVTCNSLRFTPSHPEV
jgi:hypothetical protein